MWKNLLNKILQYHGFSILCGIGIFILCTVRISPQDEIPQFPHFDKFVHFSMYFILSTLILLENLKVKSGKSIFRMILSAIIISAVFGGFIEFVQSYFTDYRSGDIIDWVFDLGGSVLACLVIGLTRHAFR